MKERIWSKAFAAAVTLLVLAGNVPILPQPQLLAQATVSALEEDEITEITENWADHQALRLTESEDHETICISTAEELALFACKVNSGAENERGFYYDRTVELQDDIDLSGAKWTPIGTESTPFTGKFCGNGHTITGLLINDNKMDYAGLFGVASSAVFDGVSVSDAFVKAFSYSSVLVGKVYGESVLSSCAVSGTIVSAKRIHSNNSYTAPQYAGGLTGNCGSGTVTVRDSVSTVEVYSDGNYTGGFIGSIQGSADISGCRADGYVKGDGITGGFVGYIYGPESATVTISDCAARGDVYSYSSYYGGFIGRIATENAMISDCWCCGAVWGVGGDIGAFIGTFIRGTIENCSVCAYNSGPRPFCGNDPAMQGGVLSTAQVAELSKDKDGTPWPEVERRSYGVKEISTAEEFLAIAENPNGCYVLVDDIDFNGETIEPIGSDNAPFRGEFYGQGHKIVNFHVNTTEHYAGLFGKISGGRVSDLKVAEGYVTGEPAVTGLDAGVGGFAGKIESKSFIENCSFTGEVISTSSYNTGGFVGYIADSPVILRCCAYSYVANDSGKDNTGGFVGNHGGGYIKDAYAESAVTASGSDNGSYGKNCGGFAGSVSISARIAAAWCRSYLSSLGSYKGAFVGHAERSNLITNSYYDMECDNSLKAAGTSSVSDDYSGITGLDDERIHERNSFTGFDFDHIWIIIDENTPCLLWEINRVRFEYKDGIKHGTVTADRTFGLLEDDIVTLTVTPDEGYTLKSLTVTSSWGDDVIVTDNQFAMPDCDVTVCAEFEMLTGGYISGASLSLNGEIGVNLYIRPFAALGDDAYVMVKGPNDNEARKLMLDDTTYRSEKQAYLVSSPVYAAQMGEQVAFTLHNSAGEPQKLWNTSKTRSYDTYTYSVKDYIDKAKAQKDDSNAPTKLAVLAGKMENYGAWSTTYMRKTGKINADTVLIAAPAEVTGITEATVADKRIVNNSTVSDLRATLRLDSQTAIRLYYAGDEITGIAASREGTEVSVNTGYSSEKSSYYVEIPNVAAQYLDDNYVVTFGDKGSVTVNGLSYVFLVLKNSTDTDLLNVVKAIYEYNTAAEAFFIS